MRALGRDEIQLHPDIICTFDLPAKDQDATQVRIHSLATNCGTSVSMIEQFCSDAISSDFKDELTI